MQKVFLDDSYLKELETMINESSASEGKTELVLEDLLFHPSGGGQLDDFGAVIVSGDVFQVTQLRKHKGEIRIGLDAGPELAAKVGFGESVICRLDWERRYRMMRLHSAAHVVMASVRQLTEDYLPGGMQMASDLKAATVKFKHKGELSVQRQKEISNNVQSIISESRNIVAHKFNGIEEARLAGKNLFRMDPALNFKGQVRIIEIEGCDFNPCGGTHVKKTAEIGRVEFLETIHENGGSELKYTIS